MEQPLRLINEGDTTGGFSFTEFPSTQQVKEAEQKHIRWQSTHRIKMVGLHVIGIRKKHNTEEVKDEMSVEDDTNVEIKVGLRSIMPPSPTCGNSIEWQVNLSAGDDIRKEEFPEKGTIQLTLQRRHYEAPFDLSQTELMEYKEEETQNMEVNGQTLVSFLAPISEEKTLNPHPLFSHIRLVLHKETFHVQKILLVQWPEEEGYTIISNRVPIQRESKRNQPEIDDSLEDRTKKKLKIT